MALKNKDGTVYRLQGPNPAMNGQTTWGQFVLHNMKWSSERFSTLSSVRPEQPEISEPNPEPVKEEFRDDFVSELEQTKGSIRIVVPEKSKKAKVEDAEIKEAGQVLERMPEVHQDTIRSENDEKPEIDKVFVHCLPAKMSIKKDSLYGEVYKTVSYGDPFSFEGVVIAETDFGLEIWTDAEIKVESVLYPKINSKRWWRVQYSEPKAMGRLLTCIPSDHQPSFNQA